MKRIITTLCLIATMLIAGTANLLASHMAGAEITYLHTGNPDEFTFTLKLYRDCEGITPNLSQELCIYSNSLGQTFNLPLTLMSQTVVPTPLCVTLPNASCTGSPPVGTEEYIFSGTTTMPAQATDWIISWSECCRNAAITNLDNPESYYLYVEALLNNLDAPANNSPQFQFIPYTTFCVGNPFYYDHGAYELDGDSMAFFLVSAQDGGFGCPMPHSNVTYAQGFSPTSPVSTTVPATFDQTTGVFYFTPSAQQVDVIAVRVDEYRNGILVGSVLRDIQIKIVQACNIIVPTLSINLPLTTLPGIGTYSTLNVDCGTDSLIIPFDTTFQCGSLTPSDFRVVDPFGFSNPVIDAYPVFCNNGQVDSVVLKLLHTITHGVSYVWPKTGSDGNTILSECGNQMPEGDTIVVISNDNSIWVPGVDSVGCLFNQVSVQLNENVFCFSIAANGTDLIMVDGATGAQLPIANAYGYCGPGGDRSNEILVIMSSQQAVTGPVYLIAQQGTDNNSIANDCGRFLNTGDTLAILHVNNVIPVTLGSDQTVCDEQSPLQLNSGYVPSTSIPVNISWSVNGSSIPGATNGTYDATTTGSYVVEVSTNATCYGTDTIDLTFMTTPTPDLGSDTTLCDGGAFPLLNSQENDPNYTYTWIQNNIPVFPPATGNTYQPNVTAPGIYTYVVEVSNLNSCYGYDTMVVASVPLPVDLLTDSVMCASSPLPLLNSYNPIATGWQWYANNVLIPGATNSTYQVTDNTVGTVTYQVNIINGGLCDATYDLDLTLLDAPVVNIPDTFNCIGATPLNLEAGSGGTTYSWVDAGTGQEVANTFQFNPPVSTPGVISYTVTATNAGGCSTTDAFIYTVSIPPVVTISDAAICAVDPPVMFDASADPSIVSWQWSNGTSGSSVSTNTAGNYVVTVTNADGCTATDAAVLSVEAVLAAPMVTCGAGDDQFRFVYSWPPIAGAASYEVSLDGGANWIPANPYAGNPASHAINEIVPDLRIRAINDLTALCRVGIASDPVVCAPVVPNIITPNGDGKNDTFTITNIEFYPNNNLKIFNRWGKEVFAASRYNNTDKVYKGDDLADGTYFVILELGDGRDALTGTLTVTK